MSAHTPGPWGRNIKPARKYPVVYAGRNTPIAIVQSQGLTDAELEANCDLIAAAPDLLAALRWALDQIKADLDPDHQAALAVARAVIATATGDPT